MTPSTFSTDRRATSAVVGVALLVLATAILTAGVGTAVFGVVPEEPPPQTRLSLSVEGDQLQVAHEGGETLDVAEVEVRIAVNGTRLAHQPPVPFFSATGFVPGPTGPFNSASDAEWAVGEVGTLTVAGTNSPQIAPGATVRVVVVSGAYRIAAVETTV
ncbi:type IV pilin N-terminal domain-containing protein [Salinirubrum litoreum]|uniref:Type IV pilin N-terminal domain-containing protein n=1 Tax=Salinirubrum litoreum TaxID=1126234 RepID=A0ABD5RDY4_9EURY